MVVSPPRCHAIISRSQSAVSRVMYGRKLIAFRRPLPFRRPGPRVSSLRFSSNAEQYPVLQEPESSTPTPTPTPTPRVLTPSRPQVIFCLYGSPDGLPQPEQVPPESEQTPHDFPLPNNVFRYLGFYIPLDEETVYPPEIEAIRYILTNETWKHMGTSGPVTVHFDVALVNAQLHILINWMCFALIHSLSGYSIHEIVLGFISLGYSGIFGVLPFWLRFMVVLLGFLAAVPEIMYKDLLTSLIRHIMKTVLNLVKSYFQTRFRNLVDYALGMNQPSIPVPPSLYSRVIDTIREFREEINTYATYIAALIPPQLLAFMPPHHWNFFLRYFLSLLFTFVVADMLYRLPLGYDDYGAIVLFLGRL